MTVRPATEADFAAIRQVLSEAFDGPAEAGLVDALRASGDAVFELVAERDGAVAGQILLSVLRAPPRCLALAPVAVRPAFQRQGIGLALIRTALDRARTDGWHAVFVLGEPDHYTRFGFSVEAAAKFETGYPRPYFMALALAPGALEDMAGKVIYPAPFLDLD